MKGYAYLDNEGGVFYKPAEYIDLDNPGFWKDNEYLILLVWKFDTDDMSSMHRMYTRFKTLKLKSQTIIDFSSSIGFNIESLSTYASSIQSK